MNNDVNLRNENLSILVRHIKTFYQVRAASVPRTSVLLAMSLLQRFPAGSPEEMVFTVRQLLADTWGFSLAPLSPSPCLVRRDRGCIALLVQLMSFEQCAWHWVWCCEGPKDESALWPQSPVWWRVAGMGSGRGTLTWLLSAAQRVFVQQHFKGLKEVWDHRG